MSDNIFEGLDEYLPMDDNIFKDKKPLDQKALLHQTLLFMEKQEQVRQQLQNLQESN